ARSGQGPMLLEMKTYRYKGHSISDPQKYRTKDEVEQYKQKDPIEAILETIRAEQMATEEELEAIHQRVDALVEDSVRFAEESPWPDDSEVLKDVYAVDEPHLFVTD
ncbi:MAG TPA: thiamine pyrophosphate-dependent enzyme, partial [Phnomibacter sp.]|nr:thiamine pyrophosphate-dependent enzyme [Phnomibacter sp.]